MKLTMFKSSILLRFKTMEHINASVQKLFDSETNDNLYDSYALYRNYATHL